MHYESLYISVSARSKGAAQRKAQPTPPVDSPRVCSPRSGPLTPTMVDLRDAVLGRGHSGSLIEAWRRSAWRGSRGPTPSVGVGNAPLAANARSSTSLSGRSELAESEKGRRDQAATRVQHKLPDPRPSHPALQVRIRGRILAPSTLGSGGRLGAADAVSGSRLRALIHSHLGG